jgi:predicted DNA-binding transcriptional regulator AlpA
VLNDQQIFENLDGGHPLPGYSWLLNEGCEMSTRLLSKRQVAEMTGFHPEHIMRLSRNDRFPRPIKTGNSANCAVRFVETEIEAWIDARRCERADG